MNTAEAKRILETALICARQPLTLRDMRALFDGALAADTLKTLLADLQNDWAPRGVELVCVASGWRFQSRPEMRPWLERLHPAPRWRRWPSSPTASPSRAATLKTYAASPSAPRPSSSWKSAAGWK